MNDTKIMQNAYHINSSFTNRYICITDTFRHDYKQVYNDNVVTRHAKWP